MAVFAIFTYDVKPGRMNDFLAKLGEAASPKFNSPVTPKSVRLFRNTVPGLDTGPVMLIIECEDMAAYGARTTDNREWKALFASKPDSQRPSYLCNYKPNSLRSNAKGSEE